ncbi:MAG: hypothetical protein ABSH00_04805 [Bryobacteraceae bacterium]
MPEGLIVRFIFLLVSLLATAWAQDYKVESVSGTLSGLPAAYSSALQTQGYRVTGPNGAWCEIWFRNSVPTGAKPTDDAIVFPIPQGALVGVLRFPSDGSDRRGQTIKAGVYTMRYSDFPVDGSHQGVAPQRDFLLLTPIANDADPSATPGFDQLVQMSTKASGTPHPAVFSIEKPGATTFPSITTEGDTPDQVLNVKIGDLQLAMIVVGKAQN